MKSQRILFFLMLVSMCIWGLSWSAAKVLSGYGSASSITYIRFILVPLTLFPLLKLTKTPVLIDKKGIGHLGAAGALMVLYTLCFFNGLQRGFAGAGGVIVTILIPILTFLVTLVIKRKLPEKIELLGLLLGATAGSILLNLWVSYQDVFSSGNLYFLTAAFIYALLSKVISQSGKFGSPVSFNLWLHTFAVFLLSFTVDFEEVLHLITNGGSKFWLNMLYFGVINSSLATTTYFYATTKLGADKASSFIFIVPSTAVFFSWLIMDESIELRTIIGGILGLIAVSVINRKRNNETTR